MSISLTPQRDDLLPGRNLIGTWQDAVQGRWLDVSNPATNTVFARVPDSGAADARAAVDAAHAAFPAWRAVPAKQRAQILKRWNDLVMANQDDLGRLISREQGKPLAEGKGEVYRAGQFFTWFAGEALRLQGDQAESVRPGIEIEVRREPVGVAAIVTPWNFPVATPAWKIAPAGLKSAMTRTVTCLMMALIR